MADRSLNTIVSARLAAALDDLDVHTGPIAIADIPGLQSALNALQDKATAATDSEVAAAISTALAGLDATYATDVQLVSAINTAVAALPATLATDAEVETIRQALVAADATKATATALAQEAIDRAAADVKLTPLPVNRSARFFSAAESIWNTPLPAIVPLADNSATLVADIAAQAATASNVARDAFSTPAYSVDSTQARTAVQYRNATDGTTIPPLATAAPGTAQWLAFQFQTRKVPIPAGAQPAAGTDRHMAIDNTDTGEHWEFFNLHNDSGTWWCTGGSYTPNHRVNPGQNPSDSGATGSGLPITAGLITDDELRRGYIPHAIGISLPNLASAFVWPATRSDGNGQGPIPEGTRFRLDPTTDIEALTTPNGSPSGERIMKMIARALRDFGGIVVDHAGAVQLRAEKKDSGQFDPLVGGTDNISGGQLLSDAYAYQITRNLPWAKLQVIDPSWRPTKANAEQVVQLPVVGTLAVGRKSAPFAFPYDVELTSVTALLGTPANLDVLADLNAAGSTVFTTQANRPKVAAGDEIGALTRPDTAKLIVPARTVLRAEVDQVGGPGAPVYVGKSTAGYATGSPTLARTSGAQTGDVHIAGFQVYREGGGATMTPPTGWVQIGTAQLGPNDSGSAEQTLFLFRLIDDGTSTAFGAFAHNGSAIVSRIVTYRGVSNSAPIDASATAQVTYGTTVTAPSVTSTAVNDLLVIFVILPGGSISTPPTGMTARAALSDGIYVADQAIPAVGATGTRTATISASVLGAVGSVLLKADPAVTLPGADLNLAVGYRRR